jgi:YVTN family beta-propeller protein
MLRTGNDNDMEREQTMRLFLLWATLLSATFISFAQNAEQSVTPPGMLFELLALNHDLPTEANPKYLSPCDMVGSLDGKQLYVAEQTAKQIAVVDLASKTVLKNIKLPNEVTGIAIGANGLLYATCSSDLWPDGMVCEVSPERGRVLRRMPAGHGARSPVISPVENILFVCNVFDGDVSVIDIGTGNEIKRIEAVREPCCAAITPDGATLVVGNVLPNQRSTDTIYVACKVTLINATTREKLLDIPLPTGSNLMSGMAISPDGKYAFATHVINMFALPTTSVHGGHITTNNCAIVDIKNRKILNDATLDAPLMGAGNPWGIACSQDGKYVCVAHAGSNELSIIDLKNFIAIAETSYYSSSLIVDTAGNSRKSLLHNLAGILDITDKVPVKSKEPRAVTVVGNQAITAGYFGDVVEVFNLSLPGSEAKTAAAGTITLGPSIALTSERKGECAFGDAGLCLQSWQSCHTCHPFARCDALNWTLRGPLVTPKNAKSMVYSWWTPPPNWSGSARSNSEVIRAAMTNELFLPIEDSGFETAMALDSFFMKLKPTPSPHLVKGKLSASGLRGKELYRSDKTDCRACHPGPLYTSAKFKYVYIPDPYDANRDIDIPSLVEAWRTAPYDHLGSILTIKEMVEFPGMSSASSKLAQEEINDLVEFVSSL